MAFRHFTEVSLMIRSEVRVTFFDETSRLNVLDPFDEINRPVVLHLSKVRLFPLTDRGDSWFPDACDFKRFDIC